MSDCGWGRIVWLVWGIVAPLTRVQISAPALFANYGIILKSLYTNLIYILISNSYAEVL